MNNLLGDILNWILVTDAFWFWLAIVGGVLEYALAIYIAHKRKNRIVKVFLILYWLVGIFADLPYMNAIPMIYLIWALISWVYKKFRNPKN